MYYIFTCTDQCNETDILEDPTINSTTIAEVSAVTYTPEPLPGNNSSGIHHDFLNFLIVFYIQRFGDLYILGSSYHSNIIFNLKLWDS